MLKDPDPFRDHHHHHQLHHPCPRREESRATSVYSLRLQVRDESRPPVSSQNTSSAGGPANLSLPPAGGRFKNLERSIGAQNVLMLVDVSRSFYGSSFGWSGSFASVQRSGRPSWSSALRWSCDTNTAFVCISHFSIFHLQSLKLIIIIFSPPPLALFSLTNSLAQ